jgi:hypothetical protein
MLQLDDYNRLFNYFSQEYLLKGIYINIKNNQNVMIFNNWEVEESNQTFVFRDYGGFRNALHVLRTYNIEINFIRFDFNFFRLKYYEHLNRMCVTTEIFNDINVIQNIINHSDIKEVSYNLKNNNN